MFGMLARSDAKISPYSGASEVSEAAKTVSDIFLRMWMTDPSQARSGAGDARSLLYGFVEQLGPPCFGREHRSGRPARALRQPLQGSGVVVESLLRFLDASLSSHDALGGGSAAPDRRSRRAHATKGGVLFPPALERALTLELRDDQPRSGARDPCHERQEPRAGHESARPRHGEVRRSPEGQSDRRVGLRGRQEPCGHRRQDRLPERHLPAHPVRANDRQGARGPPSRRAAMDQQVLHPRSHAGEELHQVRRRSGLHSLRSVVGQPGRTPRPQDLRGLHDRRSADGRRRRQTRDRAGEVNVLGYCVGGTLLASTLAYLAARGEAPSARRRFLTTQVDFSQAGDLLLFTTTISSPRWKR